jgi:Outer membrane protein Omp28
MKKTLLFLSLLGCFGGFSFAQSIQKVLIEEHTGAWCGYCPDGALILHDVLTQHPNAIAAAVHNGDGMYNSIGGVIQGFYSPSYPQATINRNGAPVSRGTWNAAVTSALQKSPVVAISIDSAGYDVGTRKLKVKLKATFLRDTMGLLRFNMYLTEDGVTGTGASFDQANYSNGTVGSPLYGLGNPILNYTHNHVFRDALGGAWGTNNFIADSVYAGEDYFITYTKTLPAAWNPANMHIIGMVNMHGSTVRPTLNAEEVPFSFATGFAQGPAAAGLSLQVYPNPLETRSTISFNLLETGHVVVDVYSLTGQKIAILADDITNAGMHSVYWDGSDAAGRPVANGMYILRLTTASGARAMHRILVNH